MRFTIVRIRNCHAPLASVKLSVRSAQAARCGRFALYTLFLLPDAFDLAVDIGVGIGEELVVVLNIIKPLTWSLGL
jgi:hypothetical protein